MELDYTYSDLSLLSSDDLNADGKLKNIFRYLLENDIKIKNEFINVIGLWECLWYCDDSIPGYSRGDFFWLNTQNLNDFIANYATKIKNYADKCTKYKIDLPEFSSADKNIIQQYYNVLTGYVGEGMMSPAPPLYEIGDLSKPIQLRISLIDNNKYSIYDDRYWRSFFVSDPEEDIAYIQSILEEVMSSRFEDHIDRFHFGNAVKTYDPDELNALSNAFLSSTVDISSITSKEFLTHPNFKKMSYSMRDQNSTKKVGFDYVDSYVMRPWPNGKASTVVEHQSYRLWNSGVLEHYGVVRTDNKAFIVERSDGEFVFRIPFDWKFVGNGAFALKKGVLADDDKQIEIDENDETYVDGSENDRIDVTYSVDEPEVNGRKKAPVFATTNYNFTWSPIYQTLDGIQDDYLSSNLNWTNIEVSPLDQHTNYIDISLSAISAVPYYSYSARGSI